MGGGIVSGSSGFSDPWISGAEGPQMDSIRGLVE